jgi:hypothetical protein
MLFYTVGQPQAFLGMMYAGLAVGLLFDMAALTRRLLSAGRALSAAIDCAYSLVCVALMAAVWLRVNYLDFRMYALLGAASGAVLYALTLRRLLILMIVRPLRHLGRWLKKVLNNKLFRKIFR